MLILSTLSLQELYQQENQWAAKASIVLGCLDCNLPVLRNTVGDPDPCNSVEEV